MCKLSSLSLKWLAVVYNAIWDSFLLHTLFFRALMVHTEVTIRREVDVQWFHCSVSVATPPRIVIRGLVHQHNTGVAPQPSEIKGKFIACTQALTHTRHTVSCESYDAHWDLLILYRSLWRLSEHSSTGITFHYCLTKSLVSSWALN